MSDGAGTERSHLVNVVSEALELFYASSCLLVRIISRADSSHASGFVPSIALGAVIEVRIWPAGAVSAGT